MTIVFSKILAQKYQNKPILVKNPQKLHFSPKFRHFCFFRKICNQRNSKVLTANMTIAFSNSSSKIPKSGTFGAKFRHFDYFTIFCNQSLIESNSNWSVRNNSEGADFKYDNSFSKTIAKKHPNKAFLVPNLGLFVCPRNFVVTQI